MAAYVMAGRPTASKRNALLRFTACPVGLVDVGEMAAHGHGVDTEPDGNLAHGYTIQRHHLDLLDGAIADLLVAYGHPKGLQIVLHLGRRDLQSTGNLPSRTVPAVSVLRTASRRRCELLLPRCQCVSDVM